MRGVRRVLAALLRQRRRLALATVAIALSIGYLAGALTLLDRVGAGLDRLATSTGERADLVVEGGVAYESPLEQVRRLVPASVSRTVAALPGVRSASPRIEDVAVLVGPGGRPLVAPGLSEQPLGANWPDDDAVAPWELVEGRPPRAPGEVVVDERSARSAGVGVGDELGVAGKAQVGRATVVGVVRTADGGLPPGASLALVTTDAARSLFDRPTDDNTVAVRLRPGADPDRVADAIRATLPPGIDVVDAATAARHRQEGLSRSFALVRALVVGFAGLALVVGMAAVANSLSLLHAQRRRTFAELRLVGAQRRQLVAAALVEAVLLAAAAAVVGLPLGVLLGRVIEAALGALDTAVPVAGSWLSPGALAWAVLVGIAATLVAAVVPVVRACGVPPVVAVTDVEPRAGSPRSRRRPVVIAVAALGAAVLAGVAAAVVTARPDPASLTGAAGGPDPVVVVAVAAAAGAVVALGSLLPDALALLVGAGVRALPLRPPPLRRLAARDVTRHRSRTAATTGALVLAVGVVAGLAVFLDSFSASVEGEVGRLVTADLVVDSGTFTRGGLPADLLARVGEVPGVAAVSGWQVGRGSLGARPVRLTGVDLGRSGEVLSPTWVRPPAALTATSVLLDDELATAAGLEVGDPVPITFTSGGTENLVLAGTYRAGSLLLGEAVVDRSVVSRQVPATSDIAGLVALDGADAGTADAVRRLAADYGVTRVLDPAEFVDSRAQVLRGFERVIQWMLLFTLVQALVGVVNTLLLSVGERRRELGLLRAAGASRRQVVRMVLLEGTSLAVVGTVVGLAVGVVGAALGVRAVSSLGVDTLVAPVGTLAVTGLAAVALGVAAAVVPARWAAGIPPLDAVADHGGIRSRPRPAQRPRWHRWGRPAFHFRDLTVPAPAPALAMAASGLPGGPATGGPAPGGPAPGAASGAAGPRPAGPGPGRRLPPLGPPRLPTMPAAPAAVPPDAVPASPPPAPGLRLPGRPPLAHGAGMLAAALADGEEVRHAVAGNARGHPCVVAVTDRRIVVVAERPHRAMVQSLHPELTGLSLHQLVADGPPILLVLDGDRMLELTGIDDVEAASLMCVAPR